MIGDERGEARWVRTKVVTERPLSKMRGHWRILNRVVIQFDTLLQSIT